MQEKANLLRIAFQRLAETDKNIEVNDADVGRTGDAFEGGFVVLLRGSAASAEIRFSQYTAAIHYQERGAGGSVHPIPELRKEEINNEEDASRVANAILSQVKGHVNRGS
jgi:hypothetical protein